MGSIDLDEAEEIELNEEYDLLEEVYMLRPDLKSVARFKTGSPF